MQKRKIGKKTKRKEPVKIRRKKVKKEKKKIKMVQTRGKRKRSIARAVIKEGTGKIRINKIPLEQINPSPIAGIISEPINIAGDIVKDLDIDVNVYGGGVMGQAEAARTAIALGIVKFTQNEDIRKKMAEVDRYLLIEDSRRVEPKKYKGRKARARFQKSYR